MLADPRLYGNWVVGASTTRAVDGDWPAVGSVLHHTQMLVLHDTTEMLESEPLRRVVLEARARPLVVAHVSVTLEPEDGGTRVVLEEWPTGGLAAAVPRLVTDAADPRAQRRVDPPHQAPDGDRAAAGPDVATPRHGRLPGRAEPRAVRRRPLAPRRRPVPPASRPGRP